MGSASVSPPANGPKRVRCHISLEGVEGHDLRASIPMVLPSGSYNFPDIPTVSSLDGNWIDEWIRESGLQPHGETEEDRQRFASEMAVFCAYLVPGLVSGSDIMKFYTWIMTLGFLADDVMEGRDMFGRDREIGLEMGRIAGDLFTGKYPTFQSIPIREEAYGMRTMIRAGWVAAQKAQEHIPNFFESATYFAEATRLAYMATLTMELEEHYEDTLGELPGDSYHYLRGYEGGFLGFIELALLCRGAVPTPAMRQNLIFKRILELSTQICINVNDLLGLRRELESGRGYNYVVYRSREVGLGKAFEEVVNLVEKEVENLRALSARFRAHCPDDHHGHLVLGVLEQLVDGHIYSFSTNRRYGNLTLEFIQE